MIKLKYKSRCKAKEKAALIISFRYEVDGYKDVYYVFNSFPLNEETDELMIKALNNINTVLGFRRFNYWMKNGMKKNFEDMKDLDRIISSYECDVRDGGGVGFENIELSDIKRIYIKNVGIRCPTKLQLDSSERASIIQLEIQPNGWTTVERGSIIVDSKRITSRGVCNFKEISRFDGGKIWRKTEL